MLKLLNANKVVNVNSPGLGLGIKGNEELGYWVGELPKGCKLCFKGSKSVLFITGLCSEKCFYCPISVSRKSRDVIFINDVEVRDWRDVWREVAGTLSEGVGITGGDPLEVTARVVGVIKSVKEVFGDKFHVHLYTSGSKLDASTLSMLERAGLDELRIHITSHRSLEVVKVALRSSLDVVVENPVLPGQTTNLLELIVKLDEMGVKYVNLNELEVSESNLELFLIRGFKINPDGRSVTGSREVAMEVIKRVNDLGLSISLHFCPATYKDLHQYSRRLMRRGMATKRVFEELGNGLVKWLEVGLKDGGRVMKDLWLKDLAVRSSDKYMTHHRFANLAVKGKIVEALPVTPRKILNETHVNTL